MLNAYPNKDEAPNKIPNGELPYNYSILHAALPACSPALLHNTPLSSRQK